MPPLQSLKTRPEFLRLKKTRPIRMPAFILQGAARSDTTPEPKIGFIITKKIGNAVVRNRIRRRLKAALNSIANSDKEHLHAGWDYVVIPSILVLTMPYEDLVKTLENALTRLKP